MTLPADTILTLDQANKLFQNLVISILGLNVAAWQAYLAAVAAKTWNSNDPIPPNPYELVRISWPAGGAPAWKITDDVCFIRITAIDDPYAQIRNLEYYGYDSDNAVEAAGYTLVNCVQFVFYGPSSFDTGRLIQDKLFRQENHDILAKNKIYLLPRNVFPKRSPELFQGQWWDRTDITLYFNELVIRNELRPYIKSAEITLERNDKTTILDITSETIVHN